MELDLLVKKVRRLVCKLKKYNIDLEVFDESDIEYGSTLGKGGEAIVQKCTVQYQGMPVSAAIKTLIQLDDNTVTITLDEIEMLCLAHDPIINTTLNVYGIAAIPNKKDPRMGHLAIITEAGIMNVLQLYQKNVISLDVTYDIWVNIAMAVHAMHKRHILHQDLKPDNILVTHIIRNTSGDIEKVHLKIIDLGMGKRVFKERVNTSDIVGTQGYHPPEVLMEEDYNFKADIFMLGISFAIMLLKCRYLKHHLQSLLRRLHYAKTKGMYGAQLYQTVLKNVIDEQSEISDTIQTMLCDMLEQQSDRNITLIEIVKICQDELQRCRTKQLDLPPSLSPCTECHDSGFQTDEEESSTYTNQSVLRGARPTSYAETPRTSRSRTTSTTSTPSHRKRLNSETSTRRSYRLREIRLCLTDVKPKMETRSSSRLTKSGYVLRNRQSKTTRMKYDEFFT